MRTFWTMVGLIVISALFKKFDIQADVGALGHGGRFLVIAGFVMIAAQDVAEIARGK
jgi:uncharacterized membrane protein